MADSKNISPEGGAAPISVGVDEELDEAALDRALAEEDPNFLQKVSEIGKDTELTISQIELPEDELAQEKEAWESSGKLSARLVRVFPILPRLSLSFKKARFKASSLRKTGIVHFKNFLIFLATDGKTKILSGAKRGARFVTEGISEWQRSFRYLPLKLKFAFFLIVMLFFGTSFFIFQSFKGGVISSKNGLFMTTMESAASEVFQYDPATESEPFYENLRAPSNIILIPKMVVNLRRSASSGENPMGAFEFFIEGEIPEVVVEIKDREVEIRDLMERVLESFTFDQVDSAEGKEFVTERLKKEIDLLLTTGQIKGIWFKTVIVKP